jgi:uncharacterized membrane protein
MLYIILFIIYLFTYIIYFIFVMYLDATGSRSETPGKFSNVMLEKDGDDQLERTCENWRSITYSQVAEEYPTWNK